MNKIKYIWGLLMLVVLSCTDFVDPAIPYSNFETATYLRTITPPTAVNFFAMGSATFSLTVEAVDAEAGTSVQEVQVFVKRRRGAAVSAEKPLTTVPGSAFTAEGKYTRTTITVPFTQVLTAMGFTQADMAGGDFVEYRLVLVDKKGRSFTNSNLSPDVSGGEFYRSPFFYRVGLVCPSALAKTYSGKTDWVDYYGVAGTNSYTTTLTAVSGSTGRYNLADLSGGMEPIVWGGAPVAATIDDVCGKIVLNSAPYSYAYYIDRTGNSFGTGSNVNITTGVITIYWINAYDEHGRTVLTPQ